MSPQREKQTARDWLDELKAERRDDRAGERRHRRILDGARKKKSSDGGPGRFAKVFPCVVCGAPDARQPDHARGCPKLNPVPAEKLLRIALQCEDAWAVSAGRKTHAASANGS
jgi:hypothetical protein